MIKRILVAKNRRRDPGQKIVPLAVPGYGKLPKMDLGRGAFFSLKTLVPEGAGSRAFPAQKPTQKKTIVCGLGRGGSVRLYP